MKEIIEVLILCGRQSIAIGGIPKTKIIPWQFYVIHFVYPKYSKHDEILQSHLDTPLPNSRIKYISPDIQNKIIEINSEMVREKLQERVISLNTLP